MAAREIYIRNLDLQLFAEGAGAGDGGTGVSGSGESAVAAVQQTKGVKNDPYANVMFGKQESAQTTDVQTEDTTVDRNAKFKELIKGEYKDLYDAEVQGIVQKRLKNSQETVDRYNELAPTLETLAKKYGVDASDIKALNKAIEEDDSYFEEEALEKGITVEQLKEYRKMERENKELHKMMEQQQKQANADKLYAKWMDEASKAKAVYPTFNLSEEMQNPKFLDLITNNVDVRTAYEVTHNDEIISGAMQFTAKTVEKKIADSIAAGSRRPTENGMRSQSAAVVKDDVTRLKPSDIDEINRRVARGEKISFG